jgi:N-methylhydantoinase B
MTIRHERITYPPRGLLGGMPGDAGVDMVNGKTIEAKSRTTLVAGDIVEFRTPGGGGLFNPSERDGAMIKNDLESGLTTLDRSKELYGHE